MPPLCETASVAPLIQKCLSTTSIKAARHIHALILTTISPQSLTPYLFNNIISMYARSGCLTSAHKLFDEMPQRNIVSFNALISAHSRAPDNAFMAFELLARMELEFHRPNGSTFTSLLQASSSLEDRILGSLIHAKMVKFGFLNDVCVQTSLLGMYSNCLDSDSAQKVFELMLYKDSISWNSIIFGNLKHDRIEEALRFFNRMLRTNVLPTQFTYSMVLNALSRVRDYHSGQLIHARIIVSNPISDLALQNALLDMYCNCGDIETANQIFIRMENPDLVSWNTIISGFSENGNVEEAMNLFIMLCRRSVHKLDEYTFASIISSTSEQLLIYGKTLHAQVIKVGFDVSVYVGSVLVSMYFKRGEAEEAEKVFYSIFEKDVVLWTEMITGHARMCKNNGGENAIKFFHEMCREGHKIDSFSISGALSACADLAILRQGEMIHSQAIKTGYDFEMSVCGSLVDMYAKNGNLAGAYLIFSGVSDPDLKCWNSMLGGYSHHGNIDQAMKLFFEIQAHGFKPDQITFLSLLSACNHSGSVKMGKYLWDYMKEYDVKPGPKHYSCMVSLLSRAGLIEEAQEMIMSSSFTDKVELWRTLLSSCVIKKNLCIGDFAARKVLELDEEDVATHILLSNLYAGFRKWDGVLDMRKKIRDLILDKEAGLSWIETRKNVKTFACGVPSNLDVDEARDEVLRLRGNMIVEVDEFF